MSDKFKRVVVQKFVDKSGLPVINSVLVDGEEWASSTVNIEWKSELNKAPIVTLTFYADLEVIDGRNTER